MSETPQEENPEFVPPVVAPEDDPDYSPPQHDTDEFLAADLDELEDGE